MNRNIIETVMGAVVLLVAVLFLGFAYSSSSTGRIDGYQITAKFGRVDGLVSGSDVRLSGIKVGSVIDQHLDPETFQAIVRLSIRNDIHLPADTAARILSDGLLGSNYLSLEPGGDDEVIEPNGEIAVTQDPVNIADLLGRFVFGSASQKEEGGGSAPPQP